MRAAVGVETRSSLQQVDHNLLIISPNKISKVTAPK